MALFKHLSKLTILEYRAVAHQWKATQLVTLDAHLLLKTAGFKQGKPFIY